MKRNKIYILPDAGQWWIGGKYQHQIAGPFDSYDEALAHYLKHFGAKREVGS